MVMRLTRDLGSNNSQQFLYADMESKFITYKPKQLELIKVKTHLLVPMDSQRLLHQQNSGVNTNDIVQFTTVHSAFCKTKKTRNSN